MQWVRLYTEILDDEKIAKISDFSYKIFTFLLLFCRERELNGEIDVSPGDLSWRFRLPENKVKRALAELYDVGILSAMSPITITKWNVRQYKSDNITERVKRFRNKNETLHETLQNKKCNVIEAEAETETETEAEETNAFLDEKETAKKVLFDSLKATLQKTKDRYPSIYEQRAIGLFVEANIKNKNPAAILHCLNSLITNKNKVISIKNYLDKALETEDGNYNARDSERECNEFKKQDLTAINNLLTNIGRGMG